MAWHYPPKTFFVLSLGKDYFEIPTNLKIRLFVVRRKEILSPKKDFLKICGSNLVLKDATLCATYKKPFEFVAESQGCLDWRRVCNEIRTCHKETILI
ncbi:MAG: hypothetical protein A2Y00_11235 [Omnitrophica WOR_2 bacterium GWF2_43_52]|nr:MAG: hypothetical protein A2Y00_11235 [Omnitrophica WOR_2 bacterium GWF2_43_52]OGX54365.1 MAG: hypothetical protein A2460_04000 [Omnitrophica WOR_2 bacterium RIFOXYC2_FULL_43_9]